MMKETKYKNTEVGVIPEDWEVMELGNCLLRNPDYGLNAAAVAFDDTLPTYLRITDISDDGRFISSGKASVNNSFANNYYLEKGDIVFARTGASVGKTYLYNENDGKLVFAGFLIRIKPNPKIVNYCYLIYLTQTKTYWAWVSANSMRSGQPGLNSNEYKSFKIPIPPTLAEQTAIATALSDADALINSLEKLIAKKRNIKQGAMQQLLKPKEGWEVKKLGDFLDYEQPAEYLVTDTEYNDNNQIPVLTAGKTFILGYTNEEFGIFKNLPVIIFDDFTTAIKYVDFPFKAKSSAMKMLLPKDEKVNLRFIYEIMLQIKYQVADHKRHWIGEYSKIEIKVPSTPEEQNEIATILSDMDAEIQALETKLEKYRKIKQGMMQNLLTGKIRLI